MHTAWGKAWWEVFIFSLPCYCRMRATASAQVRELHDAWKAHVRKPMAINPIFNNGARFVFSRHYVLGHPSWPQSQCLKITSRRAITREENCQHFSSHKDFPTLLRKQLISFCGAEWRSLFDWCNFLTDNSGPAHKIFLCQNGWPTPSFHWPSSIPLLWLRQVHCQILLPYSVLATTPFELPYNL